MKYVSVVYERPDTGAYEGKSYCYKTALPLARGDKVIAPTYKGDSPAMVVEDNVPESKIDARWADKIREITEYQAEVTAHG